MISGQEKAAGREERGEKAYGEGTCPDHRG